MSDFMKWLYAQYIKPQLDAMPQEDYELHFYTFFEELTFNGEQHFNKVMEFSAVHAFLLGMRTGAGLAPYIPAGYSQAGPSGPGVSAVTPQ